MNCCNCPWRATCQNAKPPCYVPAPYYPYIPVNPSPWYVPTNPWYVYISGTGTRMTDGITFIATDGNSNMTFIS